MVCLSQAGWTSKSTAERKVLRTTSGIAQNLSLTVALDVQPACDKLSRKPGQSAGDCNIVVYCIGSDVLSYTRTPPVEAHQPVVTYLQFPIQVCFSILSVCRPRPASHAHFRHRHPYGLNGSIDIALKIVK